MRAIVPVVVALAALVGGCSESRSPSAPAEGAAACTRCHGDVNRAATALNPALPAAPPSAVLGGADAVGAHQVHLLGGSIGPAVACANCHVVPADAAHAASGGPVVIFGAGTLATARGAAPTFDASSLTCSSTYCHGQFRYGDVAGNASPSRAWNTSGVLGCTSCHGMPPTGHPALTGVVTATTCSACHPATVKADGTIDLAGGLHVNGQAEFQGGHTDPDWAMPTHHGYQASANGLQTCTGCHVGFGTAGGAVGSSCNGCHSGGTTAWQTSCTFCHGTAGRTGALAGTDTSLPAAPPVGTQGETAATTVAVGAHQVHVNPSANGSVKGPFACTVCHPSPLPSDVTHVDGQATPVQFGGLAVQGGASPVYVRGASPSCSSTYCHGNFQYGSVTGNVSPTPAWNLPGALGCTGCHGMPPTGHPALTGVVTARTCATCHPATVKADGTIDLAGGLHMNGQAEFQGGHTDPDWALPTHHGYQASASGLQTCTGCHVDFGTAGGAVGSSCNGCHSGGTTAWQTNCTFCHGTAGRTGAMGGTDARLPAAPPVGTQGETAATTVAVGAHQAHVNPAASGSVKGPFGCTVCHPSPLPADVGHVAGQGTPIRFSGLAVQGGALPSYVPGANPTCSSTYCHGNFHLGSVTGNASPTPAWNAPGVLGCTGCHGMPPTGHPALTGVVTATTCSACHPATVKADGTIDLAGGLHMNGQAEFQGGHTDPDWAMPTHHGYQASANGLQTCTGCHVGFGTAGGAVGSSCNGCHSGGTTAWQTNCTFCHGTAGRTGALAGTDTRLPAAPPVGTQGETAATTVAVGAHQVHVNPAASGSVKGPFGCTVCHPSPLPSDVTHVDGQATPIQFGGLAVQGGASPVYVRGASPSCSSTYCHGNFQYGSVTGNVSPTPAWNAPGALGCTGCHGMPPTGHPGLTGVVTAATCFACHPATVKADGTIDLAGGLHMNGQAEFAGGHTDPDWALPTHHGYQASANGLQTCTGCHVGFGTAGSAVGSSCNECHSGGTTAWQSNCTFCHGTAGRTGTLAGTDARLPAAPPVGSQGQLARTQPAVGAHQAHVNPPATTVMAAPVACTTCHPSPLPADVAHVDGQPPPVVFSGLATNVGWGLTPTYQRGPTPTCSSTYCHGGGLVGGTTPTPSWTGSPMTCTSCHGIPPATGEHGNHPGGDNCNLCHPGVNASGSALTSRTRHVDGFVDVTHGDGTWACDTCH